MKKYFIRIFCLMLTLSVFFSSLSYAQELKPIKLPKPQTESGKPLMQVLKERKSSREFSTEKLPLQVLSNLLWAGFGINRPEAGKRTAPSAVNWQDIDIYITLTEGIYLYNAKENSLEPVLPGDHRGITGSQSFVKEVPVNLIYVADQSRMESRAANQDFYSAAHTGFISQNIYLYCTSEGLATVVRGLIDRDSIAKVMKLRPDQKVIFCQSVGYPKK